MFLLPASNGPNEFFLRYIFPQTQVDAAVFHVFSRQRRKGQQRRYRPVVFRNQGEAQKLLRQQRVPSDL